jgi:protein tyrosine/serine phosphatase
MSIKVKRGVFLVRFVLLLAVIAIAAGFSFGQAPAEKPAGKNLSEIQIKNFGQMDERFFRGAQPRETDFQDLAALGINTVIDLRDDAKAAEKKDVEAQGMRYVNIPMSDTVYPKAEQIDAFLKLAADPATGKFYVHCAGGRHRTGVIGAVYRFNHDHWNYDQVYAEMKTYDFYTRFGHGAMKQFVEDYWHQRQPVVTSAAAQTISPRE